jgi:Histidyl-tRNA synthetase
MRNVKGTYESFCPDQALRGSIQSAAREAFERYGYRGKDPAVQHRMDASGIGGEGAAAELLLLAALLRDREREPAGHPPVLAAVIAVGEGDGADALRTAALLRAEGIRVRLDSSDADVRFAVLIGETERRLGQVRLKDMADRSERVVDIEEAIYILEKYS